MHKQRIACRYCEIVERQVAATIVYEDHNVVVIEHISPTAPLHLLLISRVHIPTLNDVRDTDEAVVGEIVRTAVRLARERGFAERGYRIVFNTNGEAGQTVLHLHAHVLAGHLLAWPFPSPFHLE